MGKRRSNGKLEQNNNYSSGSQLRPHLKHSGRSSRQNDNRHNLHGLLSTPFTSVSSLVSRWVTPFSLFKASFLVVLAAIGPVIILKGFRSEDGTVPSGSGGWRLADGETVAWLDSDLCTVDRLSASDLSAERFEKEFRFQKPVLVTFPHGARTWTDPERWSLQALLRNYGQWTIAHGNSVDIVRRGGNGEFKHTLTELLEGLRSNNATLMNYGSYGFDRNFFKETNLSTTFKLPSYFSANDTINDSIFILGASGSGVIFHKHADTWNGVIYGKKRWFLYPSSFTPPGGVYHGYSVNEWYDRVYPNLTADCRPIECVQQAGEILYLPEGFYHATLNIGDTVAVSLQKKQATLESEKLFYETGTGPNHMQLLNIYLQLREILPANTEVAYKLGEQYGEVGQHQDAVDLLQDVVRVDPFFVLAWTSMGNNLVKLGKFAEAEQAFRRAVHLSPRLWDVYRHYGTYLLERGRYAEAIPVLTKGTELLPPQNLFWSYLKFAQEQTGDVEGAKRSQQIIEDFKQRT